MRIEADSILRFDRPTTFRAYRDELEHFASFLPSLKGIDVHSRDDSGGVVDVVSEWRAGPEVPAPLRGLLRPKADLLSWTDEATWNEDAWTCRWRIKSHLLPDAVRCEGLNRFVALDDNRTRVEIRGEFNLDLAKLRPIPASLGQTVARKAEQFLVRHITGSVTNVADGLARYLAERPSDS